MKPVSKLITAFAYVVIVVVFGTIGYMIIEEWSFLDALYMTVITLSTVGFMEVHELSNAGHLFTILIILFGAGGLAFVMTAGAAIVLEGQIEKLLGKRKMEKNVKSLKNHTILCGYGRVGREVANEFLRRKEPFVVIESEKSMLPPNDESETIVLLGNAADEEVLEHAGIERARAVVSTLPDDADNVYLALTARQINPRLFIIARAETNLAKRKLFRAGADKVVCPHELGGSQMAMATLRPNVVDFLQLASTIPGGEQLGIEEISIKPDGKLTGQTIIEAAIKNKYDAIVIGLGKKGTDLQFNPTGDTRMEEGDILIALGRNDNLEQLSKDLG